MSKGSMNREHKELKHQCDDDNQVEGSTVSFSFARKGDGDSPINENAQQDEEDCIENGGSPNPYSETIDTHFNADNSHSYDQFLIHGGVSHYPIGIYNISDAQRSDAATVCSGSIVEDIEVESVLSQEDHNESKGQHIVLTAAALSSAILEGHSAKFDRLHQPHLHSGVHFRTASLETKMGPPQNRQSLPNEYDPNAESESFASYTHFKLPRTLDSHSQSGSIKSFGSHVGTEIDDYEGSLLDAETNSIETKSNHSQDEALPNGYSDTIESEHHRALLRWNAPGLSARNMQQELNVDSSIIESSSKLEKVLKIEEQNEIRETKLDTTKQQSYPDWRQQSIGPTASIQNDIYDPRRNDDRVDASRRMSRQVLTKQSRGGERSRSRSRSASPS